MRSLLYICAFLNFTFFLCTSANADIANDMRYALKIFGNSDCSTKVGRLMAESHEPLVIIMGADLVDKNFRPKNAKQRLFANLMAMNGKSISSKHQKKIAKFLDYKSTRTCSFDESKVSDPILKDLFRSSDQARYNLIAQIKMGDARYSDVTNYMNKENALQEDVIVYWLQKDPNGINKLSNELQKLSSVMGAMVQPFARKLATEYDIK